MSREHDKIRKLFALADAEEGKPEGENARRLAERKLDRLGLTRADVEQAERIALGSDRELWEDALINLVTMSMECDLIERSKESGEGTLLIIAGSETLVSNVHELFTALRHATETDAGLYDKRTATRIKHQLKRASHFTFCGFAVLGIATTWEIDKLLEDIDEVESDQETASKLAPDHSPIPRRQTYEEPKESQASQEDDSVNSSGQDPESVDQTAVLKDSLDRLGYQLGRTARFNFQATPEPDPNDAGYQAGLLIGDEFNPRDFTGIKRITKV